jgi:uncharacterized DUF497 family protein
VARWDWDGGPRGNVAHIARHGVLPGECEEAMRDPRRVRVPAVSTTEPRWGIVGATADGRVLRVIFTVRRVRGRLGYRVVTAHRARPGQRGGYPGAGRP